MFKTYKIPLKLKRLHFEKKYYYVFLIFVVFSVSALIFSYKTSLSILLDVINSKTDISLMLFRSSIILFLSLFLIFLTFYSGLFSIFSFALLFIYSFIGGITLISFNSFYGFSFSLLFLAVLFVLSQFVLCGYCTISLIKSFELFFRKIKILIKGKLFISALVFFVCFIPPMLFAYFILK